MTNLDSLHVIKIPADAKVVTVRDLLTWMAESRHPEPVLYLLEKQKKQEGLANPGNQERKPQALTPDDWNFLKEIWRPLPHILGTPLRKFPAYQQKFFDLAEDLDWELRPTFEPSINTTFAKQVNLRNAQFHALDAAVRSGEVILLTEHHVKTTQLDLDCLITVEAANAYLKPLCFELQHEPPAEDVQQRIEVSQVCGPEGITKNEVLMAFESLVDIKLKPALQNGKGIFGGDGARMVRGARGKSSKHVARWNPVILALGLYERYDVPIPKLKSAFYRHSFLTRWLNEWQDALESNSL